MKLSACMIVKDEEDVIERCLDSIIDHVDEVIVVDTGSTDSTLSKLKTKQGAFSAQARYTESGKDESRIKIYEIPWSGSFADMRNKSMDLATGDVLFIIDADEYVEEQDWSHIREMINMPDFLVGMVNVMNVTTKGPVIGERVMQPRFFLNHPDIRYKYAIHNQIDDSYLAYAKKFYEEHDRYPQIIGSNFEIKHTGYELTLDEAIAKYKHRAEICREEVARAKAAGSDRDTAYYTYQLALFLTMIDESDENLALWDSINMDHLNVFNRWYASYISARAFMKVVADGKSEDSLYHMERSLHYCASMFSALEAPQTGYQELAPEPATWMIAGVALAETGRLQEDSDTVNQGIVMMIDALLRSLTPPQGMRCVVNVNMLYQDIKNSFNPDSLEYKMLDTANLKKGVSALREIQKSLVHFDDSLLELVDTEYL